MKLVWLLIKRLLLVIRVWWMNVTAHFELAIRFSGTDRKGDFGVGANLMSVVGDVGRDTQLFLVVFKWYLTFSFLWKDTAYVMHYEIPKAKGKPVLDANV